jgi:hypothetical protein
MSPEPDDLAFAHVRFGTNEPFECSPPAPAEEGFRITAPRRVLVAGRPRVPLCAVARFKSGREEFPEDIWASTAIVVVSEDGEELRVGPMSLVAGTPAPIPEPAPGAAAPGDPENDIALTVDGYSQWANVDLIQHVGWQARPGAIHVFITFAEWQSNTLRIEFEFE